MRNPYSAIVLVAVAMGKADTQMTWITDDMGTRWVALPVRKKRKSPRAVRFANIKVGEQVMKAYTSKGWRRGDDPRVPSREISQTIWYYIVTDLWFDPVAGQDNHVAGEMVAIARIDSGGTVLPRKEPHTKRGLASQGFHYADRDFITFAKQTREAENIVGIGFAQVIRRRPKIPGARI